MMTKMFRYIKKIIFYVSSHSFVWTVPKGKDVVILDEIGCKRITPFLGKGVSFFIIKHEKYIYTKHVFESVLTCKNFELNEIALNYYIQIIKRVNPSLIITNIDNAPFYWKLDSTLSKKIKFLTVQNGTHLLGASDNIPEGYQNRFLDYAPYYSNLACFSQFDFDHYNKFGAIIDNYHPIGSMSISSYISNYKEVEKTYDLCIVSNGKNHRPGCIKMIDYIFRYLETWDIKVCIALKSIHGESNVKENLLEFDKLLNFNNVTLVERLDHSSSYSSDISEVTIGHGTTLLRQTFARGNKIYPMNFVDPTMSPPYDLLGFSLSPTYSEFESHLNHLLSINPKEYREKNKKIMNYLETFDKDNPPHKRFESLVGDFIANAK
jgi:surface carbohydrate biosynthesis protein